MLRNPQSWVALVLAINILPSFTALSENLSHAYPRFSHFMGPINILKLSSPFLFYFAWSRRHGIPRGLRLILFFSLIIGTAATLTSGALCQFPPVLFREWAVIVLGVLGAACFLQLERKFILFVLVSWAVVIYGSVFLDRFFPDSIDWFYDNIFDTWAQYLIVSEDGVRPLAGVHGIQSLAKILAWLPWIFLAFYFNRAAGATSRLWNILLGVLFSLTPTLIFSTSQRGPLVGVLIGIVSFGIHQAVRFNNRQVVKWLFVILISTISGIMIFVPKEIRQARLKSSFGIVDYRSKDSIGSWNNIRIRVNLIRFNLGIISNHPLGDACIPEDEFKANGLQKAHSHNIFFQQYVDRGWIWGTLHLYLWVMALCFSWKSRRPSSSAIFGGLVTTVVLGLVDHPWFVLAHSVILGLFLCAGLSFKYHEKNDAPAICRGLV